ncbi:MAG: hypothetical protein QM783_19730 [Phycisphaerales bacterium]
MSNASHHRSARPSVVCLTACAAALALGACANSTWPPVEDLDGGTPPSASHVNYAPAPQVMGEALSFVTLRYPPVSRAERGQVYDTPFAFSLPPGADADAYDLVARRVQRGAQPATESNTDLQTYIVSRVIVRGVTAEVDILRPAIDLGTDAQGRAHYQGVTVRLLNNLGGWKVDRHSSFPVGVIVVPERTTRPTTHPTFGVESVTPEK